jgi:hypothetical protein
LNESSGLSFAPGALDPVMIPTILPTIPAAFLPVSKMSCSASLARSKNSRSFPVR